MELLDIIKQTIFLIILVGFGIFSLSYSIYRIRTRNKLTNEYQTVQKPIKSVAKPAIVPEQIIDIYEHNLHRKTSERFIVLNDISHPETIRETKSKKNPNGYQLHSINNTGMYKLNFD